MRLDQDTCKDQKLQLMLEQIILSKWTETGDSLSRDGKHLRRAHLSPNICSSNRTIEVILLGYEDFPVFPDP